MKPTWDNAPSWAQYLAQDSDDGRWYWYEEQPHYNEDSKRWRVSGGRVLEAGLTNGTLERRP